MSIYIHPESTARYNAVAKNIIKYNPNMQIFNTLPQKLIVLYTYSENDIGNTELITSLESKYTNAKYIFPTQQQQFQLEKKQVAVP